MKESTVTVFGGKGFLGRRLVRRLRERGFPSGSRRGTQIAAACRVSMAPKLNPFRPTFTTSGQSLMRLLALTVGQCGKSLRRARQ